ncbi:P-type DNA transfer ATPase VirB11 [Vibrio parahaemolyticus]|nr:P-type DNA transfer ATPase VirB11 [Vibrio parahaemolyticus]ELB2147015.1 P-type DNA transfer ATPase VirB11 [Vibrio parahaemolyticus]ELB2239697.1 P-type DNA transfer ATPase VirB11 [Vibrio parahaemolyticus]
MSFDTTITVRGLLKQVGLQALLDLPNLTEVAVNQPQEAWIDRGDGWERHELPELTLQRCMDLAKALCVFAGLTQPLGEQHPLASVILPDGERGQIAVPPATEKGIVSMTFRKPSLARFSLEDYHTSGRFTNCREIKSVSGELSPTQKALLALKEQKDYLNFFKAAVQSNLNIMLVGGTGSGKTTIMKAMVDHYPPEKRLFTIEDVHELNLVYHDNHLHLFYKQGGLTPKQLIESCMRMKPDHVLLAELRGDEAWNYLEMLNTGHQGSITTIHANDCLSAFARLATLIKQSEVGKTLEHEHIMRTIMTSIDVVAFFQHTHLTELWYDPSMKNALLAGQS